MSQYSVIITAGGSGARMGSSVPKQFIQLNEKPILMYTIERFYHFDPKAQLIVTLPEEWNSYWEDLLIENDFRIPHRVVTGGIERYDSIKNALEYCIGKYIVVHDGVRPLVSTDTLERCFNAVKQYGAVIPVINLKESLRLKSDGATKAVDRADYLLVQTPQCFEKEILLRAYKKTYDSSITDDATLVESIGVPIKTVDGNDSNIKITTQSDLSFAEYLLK